MCIYKCYRGALTWCLIGTLTGVMWCSIWFITVESSPSFLLIPNPLSTPIPRPSDFGLGVGLNLVEKSEASTSTGVDARYPPWPSRPGSLARVLIPARCPYPAHWSHIWSQLWPKPLISLMVYRIVYPSHAQSVSYRGANGGLSWPNCYFCGIYSYPYLTPSVTET